jgi:hypothetical protein
VPTLALWAGADPPVGSITGAINVTLAGQEHIESATSAEAFFEMYSFFRGQPDHDVCPRSYVRIWASELFPLTSIAAPPEIWGGCHRPQVKKSQAERFDAPETGLDQGHASRRAAVCAKRGRQLLLAILMRSDNGPAEHRHRPGPSSTEPNHWLTVVRRGALRGSGGGSDVSRSRAPTVNTTASLWSIAAGSAAVCRRRVGRRSNVMPSFGPLAFLTATQPIPAPPGTVSVVRSRGRRARR